MNDFRPALVFGVGLAAALVAAKAHGRQLRFERELAGYWTVAFGGFNPPWVDALWRRERFSFWSLELGLVLGSFGYRGLAGWVQRPLPLLERGVVLHGCLPLIGAFVLTGLASLVRCATRPALEAPRPAGWLITALRETLGWWALTAVLFAALLVVASGPSA